MLQTAPSKKILLVGNPNCGKTTLFNELTGSNQRVGNWSGVTVEQKQGFIQLQEKQLMVVDLPGTYSLLRADASGAIDERITADCVEQKDFDVVINVVDAANLERNLYLTCQLLERELPLMVVVNRVDLLDKNNQHDWKALSERLGCPVIPVSAKKRQGFDQIFALLEQGIPNAQCGLGYPESVEEILDSSPSHISRSDCLTLLEGGQASASVASGEVLEWQQWVHAKEGFEADIVIAQSRYAWIEQVLDEVSLSAQVTQSMFAATSRIGQTLDRLILHRIWGVPLFFMVMYGLFFFAINIGGAFQDFFEIASDLIFIEGLSRVWQAMHLGPFVTAVLTAGLGTGISTVVTFIPVIGAMFLALSFLEDTGYMARAAFVMDRLMRFLGLPGKSFVPLIVGFGCNVPAIMGTRTLEQRRDRVLSVMVSPFMTCGARLAIFTLFVAAFFPNNGSWVVFSLYLIGITMAILTGLLLKKTWLRGEPEPLVLELPPYQLPKLKHLGFHAWLKLKRFIVNAGKLIIPTCLVIGTLNSITLDLQLKENPAQTSILELSGKTLTPIFAPMGIEQDNWPATVGLFTGMMAKEVVIGTLNALYTQETLGSNELPPVDVGEGFIDALKTIPENLRDQLLGFYNPVKASSPIDEMDAPIMGEMVKKFDGQIGAFAYLLFVLLYFPCISATAAMLKEVNIRWTLFSVGWTTTVAYVCAVIFYQLATFNRHPLQSTSWLATMIGLIVCIILIMRHYKPSKPLPTPIMVSSS